MIETGLLDWGRRLLGSVESAVLSQGHFRWSSSRSASSSALGVAPPFHAGVGFIAFLKSRGPGRSQQERGAELTQLSPRGPASLEGDWQERDLACRNESLGKRHF